MARHLFQRRAGVPSSLFHRYELSHRAREIVNVQGALIHNPIITSVCNIAPLNRLQEILVTHLTMARHEIVEFVRQ